MQDDAMVNRSCVITDEDKRLFLAKYVEVNDEQILSARNVDQGTPEWHKWREHRIGMSLAGTIAGHNDKLKEPSRTVALKSMLWPETITKCSAMVYGSRMERSGVTMAEILIVYHLRQCGYAKVWVEQTGTCIWKEHPWLAASSDGLIFATGADASTCVKPTLFGTLENKAPAGLQFYDEVPQHYYDQFQGTCKILGAEFAVFSQYVPIGTRIQWFYPDPDYWMKEVFPLLETFYMEVYLPRAILKERGRIAVGDVDPVMDIPYSLEISPCDEDTTDA